MWVQEYSHVPAAARFGHSDAGRVAKLARRKWFAHTIVVDLRRARDATIEAFADLILLRRDLLRRGRDLRVSNLHDRAAKVYQINRLSEVLPERL